MRFQELKYKAGVRVSENFWLLVGAGLVCYILSYLSSMTIFGFLVIGPFAVGLSSVYLNCARTKANYVKNVFDGFKDFGGNIALYFFTGLFTFLWSLLLIIPGIIKAYSWALVFYIKKDNPKLSWEKTMETSAKWMKGHKFEFFRLQLSFFGWWIASIFTCGLVGIWLVQYENVTYALYYDYIKELNQKKELENIKNEKQIDKDNITNKTVDEILSSVGL